MAIFNINVSNKATVTPIILGKYIITLNYDEGHVFTLSNFTTDTIPEYSHPNNTPPSKIKIVELNIDNGNLNYDGVEVLENQEINVEDIELLKYFPNTNITTNYTDDFTFNIADEESNSYNENIYGGIGFKVKERKNQPPTVGDVEIEIDYLQSVVLTDQMFKDSSPEYFDPEGDDPYLLKITTLPTNGILKIDGEEVEENEIIEFQKVVEGLLTFTPNSNNGQSFMDVFNFEIADEGSQQFIG